MENVKTDLTFVPMEDLLMEMCRRNGFSVVAAYCDLRQTGSAEDVAWHIKSVGPLPVKIVLVDMLKTNIEFMRDGIVAKPDDEN